MSALNIKSTVGWRGLEGVEERGGTRGRIQTNCSAGKVRQQHFLFVFRDFIETEHVNGSGGYSEVHLAAEHDTTQGLVVRALGKGSREGMGRGHRQR